MSLSDSAPPPLPPHPQRGLLSIAVMLATIMIILDKTIVNVALPHMAGSLGATSDQITWVLTSYIVAEAMVIPMSGYLAKRFGRRRVMLFSIAGFVVTSFLCSQATSLTEIVIFRFAQGVAGASVIPLSQSIMIDAFDAKARGRAMAVWGMGIMVAPVAGPTLGGYLTNDFEWPSVFFINIPVGIVTLFLLAALMRKVPTQKTRVDVTGALALALGIGALQLMLDQGNTDDWFSSRFIQGCTVVGVLLIAWFLYRTLRRSDAVVDIRLLKDRNLAVACSIMFVFGFGMFGTLSSLPIYLENLMEYPSLEAGLVMAPQGLASMFAMFVFAQVGHFFPVRVVVLAGLASAATGAFLLSAISLEAAPINVMLPLCFIGMGTGLIFVSMSTLAYETLPPTATGEAASLYNLSRTIGQSVGISLASTLQIQFAQAEWNRLGGHINPFNPALHEWLQARGASLSDPVAVAQLQALLESQADAAAFIRVFGVIAFSFVFLAPLVLLARGRPPGAAPVKAPAH